MEETILESVKYVRLVLNELTLLKNMLHQFMKERNHSNVKYVTLVAPVNKK